MRLVTIFLAMALGAVLYAPSHIHGRARAGDHSEMKAARHQGIVYKSARFWQDIEHFEEPRMAFEGRFKHLHSNIHFKNYFIDFVAAYSNNCHDYLPAHTDTKRYSSQEVRVDGFGNEIWRGPAQVTTIDIDPRFTSSYVQFENDVELHNKINALTTMWGAYQNMAKQMNTPGQTLGNVLGGAISDMVSGMRVFEMRKFFTKARCNSATMHQMKENMLRVATGKSSLQSAGIRIKNAESESDSVEKVTNEKTFREACLDYHGSDKISYQKWCACLDTEARKVMRQVELSRFADNFNSYYTDVDDADKGGPTDPLWRLQKPLNKCRH